MKKILACILAVALVFSLGIAAFADFSTIDGFGSQFVTGEVSVSLRAMMYDVREDELTVDATVTDTDTHNQNYNNNDIYVYIDLDTDPRNIADALAVPWEVDLTTEVTDNQIVVVPLTDDLEAAFALSADVSRD